MTPHNEARPGDYAQTVLLPGDPQRAEWISGNFLEGARCVNRIYTDLAVIDVTPEGLGVIDIVDGLAFDELARLTGVPLRDATSR